MSAPVSRFAPWLVALLFALVAAWGWLSTQPLRTQNDSLRLERDLALVSERATRLELSERTLLAERIINQLAQESRISDLARVHVATLTSPLANLASARATLLWSAEPHRAALHVTALPVVPAENDYQIWLRPSGDGVPVNLGTFKTDSRGDAAVALVAKAPFPSRGEFFVTLESAGGGDSPGGPVVLQTVR